MQVRECMTGNVVRIQPEESVAVAARALTHYNIGILPVCGMDGRLCGMVSDRDMVTRCVAPGKSPETTLVRDVMSRQVCWIPPETEAGEAAKIMAGRQLRRLPVLENGRLCGIVSMGDLLHAGEGAEEAVGRITEGVREG